jgi:Zn-dependent protease
MPTGGGTFTLFRYRGIRVSVDWTWFIVLFLVIFWLGDSYRAVLGGGAGSIEPFLFAVASAIGFFGSILLHEFGHAIVALRNGIGITSIRLWIFGGVAEMDRESDSPGTEFKVAVAGPVVTAVLAVLFALVGIAVSGPGDFQEGLILRGGPGVDGIAAMLGWLSAVNVIVLVFNLLPAFPMDGGRITRAIAWKITGKRGTATRFAAFLGQVFGYIFIALGIVFLVSGVFGSGIWFILIGVLIVGAARAAAIQSPLIDRIEGVTIADVMDPSPVAIPGSLPAALAADEYFLRYGWSWFPVIGDDGRFIGIVNREAVDEVPEISRQATTVAELIDRGTTGYHVLWDAPLDSLLGNPDLRKFGAMMVTDHAGRLTGVVTVEQLGRALEEHPA